MSEISEENIYLAQQQDRQPISKITFDASKLSDEDRMALQQMYWKRLCNDGGDGADTGFLYGTHDSNGMRYINSADGVFDYDKLDDGSILLVGAVDAHATYSIENTYLLYETYSSACKVGANWYRDGAYQVGVICNADSLSSVTNCILAYIDGNTLYLKKMVSGSWTTLMSQTISFVSGAYLELRYVNSIASVYYNNSKIGSDIDISDSSIVNNTKHGLYSDSIFTRYNKLSIYTRIKKRITTPFSLNPVEGDEIIVNGNMETGDPPTGWSVSGGTISSVDDERTGGSGSHSLQLTLSSGSGRARQGLSISDSNFVKVNFWYKNVSSDTIYAYLYFNSSFNCGNIYSARHPETSWTNGKVSGLVQWGGGALSQLSLYATSGSTKIARFDDVSMKILTKSSCMRGYRIKNVSKVVVVFDGNPELEHGIILSVDAPESALSYVRAYFYYNSAGQLNAALSERREVYGIFIESFLTVGAVTYVANAPLEIRKSGANLSLYYNNAQVGSTVNSNLGFNYAGIFSTDSSNICNGLYIETDENLLFPNIISDEQWYGKIKRITDIKDANQLNWDSAETIGPFNGGKPHAVQVWSNGGDNNKATVLWYGRSSDTYNHCEITGVVTGIEYDKDHQRLYAFGGFFGESSEYLYKSFAGIFGLDDDDIYDLGGGLRYDGFDTYISKALYFDSKLYVSGLISEADGEITNGFAIYDVVNDYWINTGKSLTFIYTYEYSNVCIIRGIDSNNRLYLTGSGFSYDNLVGFAIYDINNSRFVKYKDLWSSLTITSVSNCFVGNDKNVYIKGIFIIGTSNYSGWIKITANGTIITNPFGSLPEGNLSSTILVDSSGVPKYAKTVDNSSHPTYVFKIYKYGSGSWSEIASLTTTGSATNGYFGTYLLQDENTLLVTGGFSSIGGVSARNIATYDGSSWSEFYNGFNATVIGAEVINDNFIYFNVIDSSYFYTNYIVMFRDGIFYVVNTHVSDSVIAHTKLVNYTSYISTEYITCENICRLYPIKGYKPTSKNSGDYIGNDNILMIGGLSAYSLYNLPFINGIADSISNRFDFFDITSNEPSFILDSYQNENYFSLLFVGKRNTISNYYSVFRLLCSSDTYSITKPLSILPLRNIYEIDVCDKFIVVGGIGETYYDNEGKLNSYKIVMLNKAEGCLVASIYKTLSNGLRAEDGVPGTRIIEDANGNIITVGGGSHSMTYFDESMAQQYGPWHISYLYDYENILEISDHILNWSLSHSEPNTAAQLSLTVSNDYGMYNNTPIFQLGSRLILQAGYVDEYGAEHLDTIGYYEIQNVKNSIEFNKQVINIEASDLLYRLNNVQHASTTQPYIHYDSQIITKARICDYVKEGSTYSLKPYDPIYNKDLVPLQGSWRFISNAGTPASSYLQAYNNYDSGGGDDKTNPATCPMLFLATSGAAVSDFELYFSIYLDAFYGGTSDYESCGFGGVILAGNPQNVMDNSLLLLFSNGDTDRQGGSDDYYRRILLCVTKNRNDSLGDYRDDYYFVTKVAGVDYSTVGATVPRKSWGYFMVRKVGNNIYLYQDTGSGYRLLTSSGNNPTFSYGFAPQWYKDNNYSGSIGLYAAPHRGRHHTDRAINFGGLFGYSLNENRTAAYIMQDIANRAYADILTEVDLESGFERRFYDNFSSGSLATDKWRDKTAGVSIVDDAAAPSGKAMKLAAGYNSVYSYMTGHNRHFTVKAKNDTTNGELIFYVRRDISSVELNHQGRIILKRTGSGASSYYTITVQKQTGAGTYSTIRTMLLSSVPIATGYATYTLSLVGDYVSIWYGSTLLTTFELNFLPSYKFDPSDTTITEYYGFASGATGDIYIGEIKNYASDLVITGLDGIIGFTINPADFYGERFAKIAETCSSLYFMRGNTLVEGLLIPAPNKRNVFSDEAPFEFEDNLFSFGKGISMEDWFTAVQTIGGDGKFGPLIVDPNPEETYTRTYYHFVEGVTDATQLYDVGKYQLEEKKRNRVRENFRGFAQLAISLRDRVNVRIHRIPYDKTSPLDIDISRLVNSYTFNFSREKDSIDLSMDVELVEG